MIFATRARRLGKSLLELLVAIAIIALILGLMMPTFVSAFRAALRLKD